MINYSIKIWKIKLSLRFFLKVDNIKTKKADEKKNLYARLGMRTNRQGATLPAETVAGPSSIILRFLSGASPHLSVGSRGRSFHQFHGKILFHVSPAK